MLMQQFSTVEVVTIFVFCIYHSFGKGSHSYWRGLTNHHFQQYKWDKPMQRSFRSTLALLMVSEGSKNLQKNLIMTVRS